MKTPHVSAAWPAAATVPSGATLDSNRRTQSDPGPATFRIAAADGHLSTFPAVLVNLHIIQHKIDIANASPPQKKGQLSLAWIKKKVCARLLLRINKPVCPGNIVHPLREPIAHVLSV